MHYDLAHALIAGVLILATIVILDKTGIVPRNANQPHRWSWKLFLAVFCVMLLFNLVWPYR